jgi:calcium-binding protein CML
MSHQKLCVKRSYTTAQPITPQNMTDLKHAFSQFDTNSDGFISKQELAEAMSNLGHIITNEELNDIMKAVDKDGNGLVDFKEFMNLMDNNCLVQNVDEEMQHLFSMIDINKDGYITEKEIKAMMKGLGEKVRKKDIRKMIKEADENKDGKISFNEFKTMVQKGNFLM